MAFRKHVGWAVLGLLLCGVTGAPAARAQSTDLQSSSRKVKKRVEPVYPALGKQFHLAGKVRIELTVAPDGTVLKTRLVGGSPLLATAASDAVKLWKYEPGPKETLETIDFDFRPEQ